MSDPPTESRFATIGHLRDLIEQTARLAETLDLSDAASRLRSAANLVEEGGRR